MATQTNTDGINLWNGPSLLIPIDVEALVVSELATNMQWSYGVMDYTNANDFENIRPNLGVGAKTPGIGVTLHWALPDALTHGVQSDGSKIKYPNVPNRWLVVRLYDGKAKSWVLQSDYLHRYDGSNSFLDPNQALPTPTRIGKKFDTEEWRGEDGIVQQDFLTALAPGNASFAAYIPNINNVFSFYDDMNEIKGREIPVTYVVSGWYSKAENDILYGPAKLEEWENKLKQLSWGLGGDSEIARAVDDWMVWARQHNITVNPDVFSDNYPVRTICNGMVYKVNWLGENGRPQSGRPTPEKGVTPFNQMPRVAVANTSIDALAALVKYELDAVKQDGKGDVAAELLEAFNYNLLDKYDKQGGQFELYREIFKAWFAATDGEQYYYIEDTDSPDTPFIEPERLAKLVELNTKANKLNAAQHLLSAAQKGLYGNWWKWKVGDGLPKKPKEIPDSKTWNDILAALLASLNADAGSVTKLKEDVNTLAVEVGGLRTEVADGLGNTRALKENTGGRYYQPNDPVVLIYGAGRSYRHGEDGRFDAGGKMLARFTGQTISALTVTPDGKTQKVATADLKLPDIGQKAAFIPKESVDLLAEAYFFDTTKATAIATIACTLLGIPFNPVYAEDVIKQQTGAWNADVYRLDRVMVADAAGFEGVIPSKIAVNPWAAPWCPLYLAWEITWLPTNDDPKKALEGWKYDPAAMEYDWNNPITGNGVILHGSTTITPKSAFVMQAQFEKYFEDHKFPELQAFLSDVSNWDFLSQSLSGLNEALLALNPDQFNVPDGIIADAVGNNTQLSPIPEKVAGFNPIRAGHFKLRKLWVVDDFGQVFDPISIIGPAESYTPIRGTGMETRSDASLIQLPPRITQNARLNFDLMSGDGMGHSTRDDQTVNPICGWLLPNHIDKALSLYTPDGHLLGELILVNKGHGFSLRWEDAPGKNIPVGTPLESIIENKYLLKMVGELLEMPDEEGANAFADLLETIDKTLWTIEPLGGRNNELVSVFIGRPLALVKTRLQYQLRSGPQYSQAWMDSAKQVTGGYETVPFPIELGSIQNPQDGTLGYYFDDFATFNSLWKDNPKTRYIASNPVTLSFDGAAKNVFVLVDPRGEMNAVTGILPMIVNVLPGPLVETAMANMNVTFRTGPLITDPDKLAMPLPSEISGNWSWIQHTGITTWDEVTEITQANQKPRFGENNMLKDGWLKLSNALKEKTS